jgi:hypothetical protein
LPFEQVTGLEDKNFSLQFISFSLCSQRSCICRELFSNDAHLSLFLAVEREKEMARKFVISTAGSGAKHVFLEVPPTVLPLAQIHDTFYDRLLIAGNLLK